MSYHNLTNEEIVFMFLVAKSIKEQYEIVYEQQTIEQSIPTEHGMMKVETIVPAKVLEDMLESKHYTFMRSIYLKLLPIYEIIMDSDPDLVAEIKTVFDKKL